MTALEVPELVRQRACAAGAAGQRWLDDLPALVEDLCRRWDLTLGDSLVGGTASYVSTATDGAGRCCVLKVALVVGPEDDEAFRHSVLVHQLAAGRGCVALHAHDEAAGAMLVERLGPDLAASGTPSETAMGVIVTTLKSFWRPVAADCGLPTGAEKAVWLADAITSGWERLGRPCRRSVIDRAVRLCDERAAAYDPGTALLVHGDAHAWNTLDAGGGAWKFVDPEGIRSEPAHDLAVPMREDNRPLLEGDTARLVRERAERLAGLCGVDPEPVWQWGFVERVSTGLVALEHFQDPREGEELLAVAERCG